MIEEMLGPNGRVTAINNEFFKIEGHNLQIAQVAFEPQLLKYESLGFEDNPVYTLPPHIMEQLGEALILMAHLNFERMEKTAKKEIMRLRKKKENK